MPVNRKTPRGMEVKQTWMLASYVAGVVVAVPTLLAGLFALKVRPMSGTLMLLAAMALLLSALSELCHSKSGIQEPDLEEKH